MVPSPGHIPTKKYMLKAIFLYWVYSRVYSQGGVKLWFIVVNKPQFYHIVYIDPKFVGMATIESLAWAPTNLRLALIISIKICDVFYVISVLFKKKSVNG